MAVGMQLRITRVTSDVESSFVFCTNLPVRSEAISKEQMAQISGQGWWETVKTVVKVASAVWTIVEGVDDFSNWFFGGGGVGSIGGDPPSEEDESQGW